MKVRLATQIYSKTMVCAMNDSIAPTIPNTSGCLLLINNLFNVLNSSNPHKQFGKELFCAEKKIKTFKVIDKSHNNITNRFKFLKG